MAAPQTHPMMVLLRAMRPKQWVKNLLLFAGLFFSHQLLVFASVRRAVGGFVVFCLLSSAVYMINDVRDAPRDRLHPIKRQRPVASGALGVGEAVAAALVLLAAGLAWAWLLSPPFAMCALAYALMMIAYSLQLKEVFLIDTLVIALGFMIRAVAGVIVLRTPTVVVPLTAWFVICVMFLSLLLAFCKRRAELSRLDREAPGFRPVLALYSPLLLDQAIALAAAGAILSYALYATGTRNAWVLLSTLPFVLFGVLRYLHLVYNLEDGDAPEQVLLSDGPLLGSVLLWAAAMLVVFTLLGS